MKKVPKQDVKVQAQEELGRLKDKYSKAEKKKKALKLKKQWLVTAMKIVLVAEIVSDCNCGPVTAVQMNPTEVNRVKELAGIYTNEETYDGDDSSNNYGDMWYNEDEILGRSRIPAKKS